MVQLQLFPPPPLRNPLRWLFSASAPHTLSLYSTHLCCFSRRLCTFDFNGAGVVAIQEMGGPVIPWRPGRSDAASEASCPPDGRLPDASKKAPHLRDIFYRMGFNDQVCGSEAACQRPGGIAVECSTSWKHFSQHI